MAGYNQEFPSRLIADGFTFYFQQHQSAGMSLTFTVSAYSRDRLIGEEIRYIYIVFKSIFSWNSAKYVEAEWNKYFKRKKRTQLHFADNLVS